MFYDTPPITSRVLYYHMRIYFHACNRVYVTRIRPTAGGLYYNTITIIIFRRRMHFTRLGHTSRAACVNDRARVHCYFPISPAAGAVSDLLQYIYIYITLCTLLMRGDRLYYTCGEHMKTYNSTFDTKIK